jgi:holliday junction DNA helicase RuvA
MTSTRAKADTRARTAVRYHEAPLPTRPNSTCSSIAATGKEGPLIGRLVGNVVATLDSILTVDVGGVGYEVHVPRGTVKTASGVEHARVTLFVHTHVREDTLDLFGFASEIERVVFRLLIAVPNVGPKTALGILSALPPPELASAVGERDLNRLTAISGIGKKTAERLVLELKEKLPRLAELRPAKSPERPSDDAARLTGALTNMGYRPAEAERAVAAVADRIGKESLSELLKAALAQLG